MVRNGMRVSDAGEGKMGTFSFVQPPENGNYYLSLAKRLLLPLPAVGQLGDDIVTWLTECVKFEGQVKLWAVPREKVRKSKGGYGAHNADFAFLSTVA